MQNTWKRVIHYTQGCVCIVSLEEFAQGATVNVKDIPMLYKREVVIERAMSRLGERGYNLLNNNCEHFVNWCRSSYEW